MSNEIKTLPMDSRKVTEVRARLEMLASRRVLAEQVGREAGVSPATVRRISRAERKRVSLETLERISMVVDDLLVQSSPGRARRPQDVARDRQALLAWFESRGRVRPGQTLTDLIGIGRQAA